MIQEGVKKEQEVDLKRKDKDYIELNGLEKIRDLEVNDKYHVLEYLIKEML